MATITLGEQLFPVRRILSGSDSQEADANTVIKFKVGNNEILDEKVPAGKKWRLAVQVRIEESDA